MTKTSQPPQIEIVIEDVPLPSDLAATFQSQLISITSKDYSTVANTWGFTALQPSDANLVDIIREDFTDGVSFQRLPIANNVVSFAQSSNGQALLVIDKSLSTVIIRRNKETSFPINLLPDLRVILEKNPQACSPSFSGYLAISNDARQCCFYAGTDEIFYFIQRSHRLPSWITLKLDWPTSSTAHQDNAGRALSCRFIQTEAGTTVSSLVASFYSKSSKTGNNVLVVSPFLIRPLLDQPHFLSRPQCGEVKQFKFTFQLRSFGATIVPNHQHGSLVSSVSHSGNILAIALNQNQSGFSASNSRLLFIGLHIRALVVCRLHRILDNQSDCITAVEWLRSDLMCAVSTARGRFAIFAVASGALHLVLTSDIAPSLIIEDRKDDQSLSIELLQTASNNVLMRNKLAVHVSEPVFLCYSLVQAGHVLLRNVPQRMKIVRDYYTTAAEYINGGDFIAAGRLNLSAWGLIATCIESFNDRQLQAIRHLSVQTFQICQSFINERTALVFERFAVFVTELKNLLGFSIYNEDAFSLLAETITLSVLLAFDQLLPSAATNRQHFVITSSKKGPPPEILMQLFRLVTSLDTEIRQCHRHLDAASSDVKNIHVAIASTSLEPEVLSRSKTHNDSFPALSWALNFYERLYLESCRQIITAEDSKKQALMLNQYKPLLQRIQAACALVCPIGKCVAALADFKVAPGVDDYLNGNYEAALRIWSTSFAELRSRNINDLESQRNLLLTSLFGLLTSNRVPEAVLLADFVVLNIICPVRRKVEFSTAENEEHSFAHMANFSYEISGFSRLNLLVGPFCNFVGNLAVALARWLINEPICIPPALQPRDADFDKVAKKNDLKKDTQRLVCVDPSFVAKADSLALLSPSKIMLQFLLTGRYNDAIRLAENIGNSSMAIVLALAVHLFSNSVTEETGALNLRPEFTPSKQIRTVVDSYTKPVNSILDFLFLVSTLSSGTSNVSTSTLKEHVAVSSGAVDLKYDRLPKIPENTLHSALLLSTICKKSAICRWSRTLCDLLHKSCYPLSSLFFSHVLSRKRNTKTPLRIPSPIYCPQIFESVSADDTVLTLVQNRLSDLHRKLTADLVDSFIATLKCSKTLNAIVALWKKQLSRIYMAWSGVASFLESIFQIENPSTRLFTADVISFDDQYSAAANSTIEILSEDFSSLLASLALWHLVDIITASWNNYLEILETDATNTTAILLKEDELINYFACLLPFSLLFSSSQNGKSLCFDVIVKIASQFTPRERLAKLFGYASSLLVELFGEELFETFVNPRLEPLLDSWKGVTDKETDASLIFVYANQLKNGRKCFTEFRQNSATNPSKSNFLSNFASLLLSSSLMSPFVANLFNVRFNPIVSLSKCQSWNEMLIPENWSSVMSQVLQEAKADLTVVTTKSLISNCLEIFMSSYPDNSSFTGHLAVGNLLVLFKHIVAVIRESSVWKAGAGGRTLAELERRRGDSNMAEFYQLIRSLDYPQFVNEVRAICNRFSKMDFTSFSYEEDKKASFEGSINPNVIVHIFWMREVRSTQETPAFPDLTGLASFLEEEDEEGRPIQIVPVEIPKENVSPEIDNEPPPDIQDFWDSLKPPRRSSQSKSTSSSSSTSQSITTTGDLSVPGRPNQQPPMLPFGGARQVADSVHSRKTLSSSQSVTTISSSVTQPSAHKTVDTVEDGARKDDGSFRGGSLQKAPSSESFHLSEVQERLSNSIAQVLQEQAASFETFLTGFSQQQSTLIQEMVSLATPQQVQLPQTVKKTKKHKGRALAPLPSSSSSDFSSGPSSDSFPNMPKLLTLSCPPTRTAPTNNTQQTFPPSSQNEAVMPRMLTLKQPDVYGFIDENYLSEERLVGVFKAATSFSSAVPCPAETSGIIPDGRFGSGIPPLIGVGMLRRFRVRKRHQKQQNEEPQSSTIQEKVDYKAQKPAVATTQNTRVVISYQDQPGPPVYKSTVGVNTEKLRMVSVGITATTTSTQQSAIKEVDQPQEGIFDGLLQQSQRAIQSRQDEFGAVFAGSSKFLGAQVLNEPYRPPADIGLLNYFNRRPMPPVDLSIPALPKPQQKILVSSGTETDPEPKKPLQPKAVDAMEKYTTARSGLDENLRLINSESFAILEEHLGLSPVPPMSSQFVSVSDVAKRDFVQQNVEQAEAELDKLLENARKTIGWRSDQRTAQTQTEQEKKQDIADSWDIPASHYYDSGLKLVAPVISSDQPNRSMAVDNALLRNWSKRLDAIDEAGKAVRNEMKQIAAFSAGLVTSEDELQQHEIPAIDVQQQTPRTDDDEFSNAQLNSTMPPIFKKSVSFSESYMESPRQAKPQETDLSQKALKTGGTNQKSSSSPTTTPSTPHLDVVQLIDTGSLQPRSVAASRTPRTPRMPPDPPASEKKRKLMSAVQLSSSTGGASSTTTTTPSDMIYSGTKNRESRPPFKKTPGLDSQAVKQMMEQRLDDASKLVAELLSEQEKMRSRSKERWSVPAEVASSAGSLQKQRSTSLKGKAKSSRETLSNKPTLSETDRREAAVLESQFRDILLGFEPAKQQIIRNIVHQHHDTRKRPGESRLVREKEQQLEWLLEREADLAKPPSEPSEDDNEDNAEFAEHLRDVDPAIADLLDKYSVHSGSVFSIVDWGEVDKVLAQEGDPQVMEQE